MNGGSASGGFGASAEILLRQLTPKKHQMVTGTVPKAGTGSIE
jgi:hypothetical protein